MKFEVESFKPPEYTRVVFKRNIVIDEDSIKNIFIEKNDTKIRIDEWIKQIVSEAIIEAL